MGQHALAAVVSGVLLVASPGAAAQSAAGAAPPVTPPRLVHFVDVPVPASLENAPERTSLETVLTIEVGADGLPAAVHVETSSGHPEFDEDVVLAARRFVFEPARREGVAIGARIRFRYRPATAAPESVAALVAPPPPITMRGHLEDSTGRGVAGASITVTAEETPTEDHTISGDDGGFALAALGAGRWRVRVEAPGFAPFSAREEVRRGEVLEVRYRLRPRLGRYESVVRATADREVTRRSLGAEEIRRIPGTGGDPLRVVENLPGVARAPFGLGLFVIRGSSPESTLVTLEGHPIPLPYHFGGLASVVNFSLIEGIDFLPGSFGVRYGRVSGGEIDVRLRSPRSDGLHGYAELNLIDASALVEGPIGRRLSVAAAFRRSYVDAVLPLFFPRDAGLDFTVFPVYWDYQILSDWRPTPKDTVRLIVSGNDDSLAFAFAQTNEMDPGLRGAFRTHLSNHGMSLRWRRDLGAGARHSIGARAAYNVNEGAAGPNIDYRFASVEASFRDELELRVSRELRLFVGVDVVTGRLDTRVRAPARPEEGVPPDPIAGSEIIEYRSERTLFNPAVYLEAEMQPNPRLRALAGLRADYFGLLTERPFALDPRLAFRWQLHPRLSFKGGVGSYSQPPRADRIVEGFGNPDLEPERAIHYFGGIEWQATGAFFLDAQFFYKDLDHLAARCDPAQSGCTNFANTGTGRVFGGEWLLLFRPPGPLFGWLAYTLSRSERRDAPGAPVYRFGYDETHILTVVFGALLPGGFEAGLRFRYITGTPEVPLAGGWFDADRDVYINIADRSVESRLPDFYQLDVRVAKRFRWGAARILVILDVQNATNHANAEQRTYNYDRTESTLVTGLPIIPSLGLRVEF